MVTKSTKKPVQRAAPICLCPPSPPLADGPALLPHLSTVPVRFAQALVCGEVSAPKGEGPGRMASFMPVIMVALSDASPLGRTQEHKCSFLTNLTTNGHSI